MSVITRFSKCWSFADWWFVRRSGGGYDFYIQYRGSGVCAEVPSPAYATCQLSSGAEVECKVSNNDATTPFQNPFPERTSVHPSPVTAANSLRHAQSSPQHQKPFSFAPSSPFASASFSMSSVTYPVSPVSTPSRVVHYSIPPGSSSTNTQASSTSTVGYLATPSPVVSAYRGKHAAGNVGREFIMTWVLLC